MNPTRATRALRRSPALPQRTPHVSRRAYAAEPPSPHPPSSPPNPNSDSPPKDPSRVGAYYKTFGSAMVKCFLGALFTYQITYYAWMRLEAVEETHQQQAEISDLQDELQEAIAQRKDQAGEVVGKVVEGVREGGEEVVRATGVVKEVAKGGWWPW